MSIIYFKNALIDYRFLKKKSYPVKAALKLVGDKYRLSRVQRNCLLRGVFEPDKCMLRKKKLIPANKIKEQRLAIDWYNILITIESYLKGATLFLADDHLLRDSAGVHSSYRTSPLSEQAIDKIIQTIEVLLPQSVIFYLDSPISKSKQMADFIKKKVKSPHNIAHSIVLSQSADYELKQFSGIVSSSDSIIIDNVKKIFDLSRFVLEHFYNYKPPLLDRLIFNS